MARATKRPKTGVYQIRKRIPADVRAIVGGPAVFKQSLKTKDSERAAAEFRRIEADCEARWAEIRKGAQHLDHERIEAIGGEVYRDLIERTGKNRGMWIHHSFAWFLHRCEKLDEFMESAVMEDWWPELESLHGANLDKILDRRGMIVPSRTRDMLLLAAHRAGRQIAAVIIRQVNGDYTPDPGAGRFPEMPSTRWSDGKGEFEAVWSAWIKAAKPSQNTLKRWRPVLDRMIAFAGESNLGRIGEATLNDWIASLLEELGNNTIAKVHLAATKRIFSFALTKKLISRDPTTGLKVESGKKYEVKMRGYWDHEASIILKACLDSPSDRLTVEHRAARRWVPWICAYTGARVNEITQLRACDVWTMAGRLFIDITPEAGTAKTGARTVPLHEHLRTQGFMDFVATKSGDEPLFYAASRRRRREGAGGMPPYEEMGTRLSKWVRRLGIDDKHVDPNHAWRHRFKTVAHDSGIEESIADAIQGHAPTTSGRRYGEVSPSAMANAISKVPQFEPLCEGPVQAARMGAA